MDAQSLLRQITPEVLARFFRAETIARGQAYIDQVSTVDLDGLILRGKVQGNAHQPYHTQITLSSVQRDGQPVFFRSVRCTCPVGSFCKHAVALLLAAQQRGIAAKPRQQILDWLEQLPTRIAMPASKPRKPSARQESILYVIMPGQARGIPELVMVKAVLNDSGQLRGQPKEWVNHEQALLKPPAFVCEDDLPIFRRMRQIERKQEHYGPLRLQDEAGQQLFEAILATGRCWLGDASHGNLRPLHPAQTRPGQISWLPEESGLRAGLQCEPPASHLLPLPQPYYIDAARGETGPVSLPFDAAGQRLVAALLELPPLTEVELPLVAASLQTLAPDLPRPRSGTDASLPLIDTPLQPVLQLATHAAWGMPNYRSYPAAFRGVQFDYALPCFRYGEVDIPPDKTGTILADRNQRHVSVKRDQQAEEAAMKALQKAGFRPARVHFLNAEQPLPAGAHGLSCEEDWQQFFGKTAATLQAAGWQIACPPDFRHRILEISEWHAEITESENGWFDLSLGIEVDGQKIELAPLLSALFRRDARWLDKTALTQIDDQEPVILLTPDGSRIRVVSSRIKPLAQTMIDLFDSLPAGQDTLSISPLDADRVGQTLADGWETDGLAALAHWQDKLRGIDAVQAISEPTGFGLTLRDYQREGLAWLQHLRRHDLAGILADDMGLGKTAQTLAHLLTEKQAGRLDLPVLVVLPTSLVFNWQREAERFAPDLRVLKLQGPQRHASFAHMAGHDVCLTTYPLLARDSEYLTAQHYHMLILDEAQTVKNASSKAAQVIRTLQARHRLCLTGTPLENHLGELWSLFDFLMPGLLGTARDFSSRWRTPIEKHGDLLRREILARRLAPFILRRRKQDVARELPPKTTVIRTVELEGRQRDLYETVRAAMDQRVREEISQKGFARSQIVILDALLKLRQICCDPRLLKMDAATRVKERAKLDLLMDMLPELIEEGRKVLVFSQFTSMLALIEAELAKLEIPCSLLTGDTQDREQAIKGFQEGSNPVFLISLKAGGVGLNLTAADTVIHFDPWWNPAAENQATDRAHRIGQTCNVFVYKLVVAGSIEEKILALQEKKAQLAAGILSEDQAAMSKFGEDDIRNLLAPLPEKS